MGPSRARGGLSEADRDVATAVTAGTYVVLWFIVVLWLGSLAFAFITAVIPLITGYIVLDRLGGVSSGQRGEAIADGGDEFVLPMDSITTSRASDVGTRSGEVSIPKDRSLMAIGASGAGKTNTISWLVDQLDSADTEPTLIFEMKDDYKTHLDRQGIPAIVLSAEDGDGGGTHRWNLFREIDPEHVDRDARELAKALMPKPDGGKNDYFKRAASQVFKSVVLMIYYGQGDDEPEPTNQTLVDYFQYTPQAEMCEELEANGFMQAAEAIDPDGGTAASNVYTGIQVEVEDLFAGAFAEPGDFSIREYMTHPETFGGAPLVLDFPARGASTARIYAHLIDDAIMYGLDDLSDRTCYYLLDEIEHLGSGAPISNLDRLLNLGRGASCVAVVTLQSVAQLRDSYSRDRADALLSGAYSTIMMRAADQPTVDYYQSRLGQHREEKTGYTKDAPNPLSSQLPPRTVERETRLEDVSEFATGDLVSLDAGEAIIVRGAGQQYVHGRVALHE